MSPLRWTCKSTTRLAAELARSGHRVSQRTVCDLLAQLNYSLQSVRKTREGAQHPDRDAQFHHIATMVTKYQRQRQPVISVDTKKKELIGDFKNAGREWQPAGAARAGPRARLHRRRTGQGRALRGLRRDGQRGLGQRGHRPRYGGVRRAEHPALVARDGAADVRQAKRLLITADCGGSNGYRVRLWRLQLQRLADELGLKVQVCHFPPGTSKWNKIEHRMFCHITNNWRGRPLLSRQMVVNLIGSVTTDQGLRVKAALDENTYDPGIKVSDSRPRGHQPQARRIPWRMELPRQAAARPTSVLECSSYCC